MTYNPKFQVFIILLAMAAFCFSCQTDEDPIQTQAQFDEQNLQDLINQFEAQLDESYDKDAWKKEVFSPNSIPTGTKEVDVTNPKTGLTEKRIAQIIDGHVVIGGDIVLGTEAELAAQKDRIELRGIIRDGFSARWPYGVVPFEDFSSHPQSERIREAMREIEDQTNLSFRRRTNETNYLEVYHSTNGNYVVGLGAPNNGKRKMYITSNAEKGTILHELLHVAGMGHEQKRCDRDKHVIIHESNILQDAKGDNAYQFAKSCNGHSDVYDYDYGSIMHYSPYAFSKNGISPTITPNTSWPHLWTARMFQMGQRSGLSDHDISTINHMYPIDLNRNYALFTHYPIPGTSRRLVVEVSGNKLYLNSWRGHSPQQFRFLKASDGYYYIQSIQTGKYITIAGGSSAEQAAVQLENFNGGDHQQFRFEPESWSTYRFYAKHSNKVIKMNHIVPGQMMVQGGGSHTANFTTHQF